MFQQILHELQGLKEGQQRIEEKVSSIETRVTALEEGQKRIEQRVTSLEEGQKRLEQRVTALEEGQQRIEQRVASLEAGQAEIINTLKHHMTLMTENFTAMRQDLNKKQRIIDVDIDLLFRETGQNRMEIKRIKEHLNI